MRASYLLIAIPLEEKAGGSPSPIDLARAIEVDMSSIFSLERKDGFFHLNTLQLHRKIGPAPGPAPCELKVPAVHPGTGIGVFSTFKLMTAIDKDLRTVTRDGIWAMERWQLEAMIKAIDWSQKATHDLLGRPFGGKMPYAELQDYM